MFHLGVGLKLSAFFNFVSHWHWFIAKRDARRVECVLYNEDFNVQVHVTSMNKYGSLVE